MSFELYCYIQVFGKFNLGYVLLTVHNFEISKSTLSSTNVTNISFNPSEVSLPWKFCLNIASNGTFFREVVVVEAGISESAFIAQVVATDIIGMDFLVLDFVNLGNIKVAKDFFNFFFMLFDFLKIVATWRRSFTCRLLNFPTGVCVNFQKCKFWALV